MVVEGASGKSAEQVCCINASGDCPSKEKTGLKLMACARCGIKYCSRSCQVAHWKRIHKDECALFKAFRRAQAPLSGEDARIVVERQLRRVRLYLCPFAVSHHKIIGNGFLFVRSESALADFVSMEPTDVYGRTISRGIVVQYLTLGEFDGVAFEDDFELSVVREPLKRALEAYDPRESIVVVMLLRCGFFSLIKYNIVQGYDFCLRLGTMYEFEKKETVQLNLDDV